MNPLPYVAEKAFDEAWDRARTTQPELFTRYTSMRELVSKFATAPSPNDNERWTVKLAS